MNLHILKYTLDPSEKLEVSVVRTSLEKDPTLLVESVTKTGLEFFQAIPSTLTPTPRHLAISAYFAYRAFKNKKNISKKPHLEILLYLVGTRQISQAISKVSEAIRSKEYYLVLVSVEASKNLEEIVKSYKLKPLKTEVEPVVDCTLCREFKLEEISSYKGEFRDKVEKACISKSALLHVLI